MNERRMSMTTETTASDTLVFRGHNGLWITLLVLAGIIGLLTLVVAATSLDDGAGSVLGILVKGGGLIALLALGAWFAARQRREVVLDSDGVTIREPGGKIRHELGWEEITQVESRTLPSQPFRPAVLLHRTNGTVLLIDPQQVRETSKLASEAARLLHEGRRRGTPAAR